MGVLNVNVGTASVPDWREIGCGGHGGSTISQRATPPWTWGTLPVRAQVVTYTFVHAATPAPSGSLLYWFEFRQNLTTGAIASLNLVAGDSGSYPRVTSRTVDVGAGWVLVGVGFNANGADPAVFDGSDQSSYELYWGDPLPTTGRLKLWDGTRWMREACDSDTGGTNALSNPGAESGTTGYVIYTGDSLTAPSTPIHSGSASFAVTRTITSGTFNHVGMRSSQSLSVTPGQSYALSGWIRTNGWSADYPTLIIEFLDAFGAYLGGILDNPTATIDGTAWTFISTSAVAPSGSVQARLTWDVGAPYQSLGAGTYIGYFDDLSFTGALERHPLKMWDGTTWQTVACLTPA